MNERADGSETTPAMSYEAPKIELLGDFQGLTQMMATGTVADMASFSMMS